MLDPISSHFFRQSGQHGAIFLMYHSIEFGRNEASWPWAISLDLFEDHLDLLRDNGWTTRTMAEVGQEAAISECSKTIVITFDDGFENNLAAVDALVKRDMRATWFIVTGSIGQRPSWEDPGRPNGRILGVDNLRTMKSAGMEIGSHSVSHCKLPTLNDSQLVLELTQSKETLEDILSSSVASFAYPYGDWDERCEMAVSKAGYRFACNTRTGPALKDDHPLRMRRLSIFNHDSASMLARKLTLMSNDGRWQSLFSYYGRRAAVSLSQHLAR